MMAKTGKALNKTDKAYILDMDGNRLAVFHGYDWPGLAAVQAAYPSAFKARIVNRTGFTRATIGLVAS
jgi:hypothetical protein